MTPDERSLTNETPSRDDAVRAVGSVRLLAVIAAVVLTIPVAPLSSVAQEADGPTLIRNVSVIDGTGASVRAGMDVTIVNGLITRVEATSKGDPEEEAQGVIDATGLFLIPGLVDSHVHLSGAPSREASAAQLRWALEGGVTSLRDMAGDARVLAGLKQALISGEISGPSIYYAVLMAGPPFMSDPRLAAATAGYEEGEAPYMVPLTLETDIPRAVAMAKGAGATGIKLYAALEVELVAAVTAEAHRSGLEVWGHSAIFPAKPIEILDTEVDGVSHAPYVIWEAEPPTSDFTLRSRGDFDRTAADGLEMDRVISAMVRNGTLMDPTLFVFHEVSERDGIGEKRLRWGADFTRRAHNAGVAIAAGTDGLGEPLAGALPNVHSEMELLVDLAGFTPLEALKAGTLNGARAIGIEARSGSVQVGKSADLVLLSADPSLDIRNSRRIEHVFLAGRLIR
jgi:imidazolonepropionase-like amidohydrolase